MSRSSEARRRARLTVADLVSDVLGQCDRGTATQRRALEKMRTPVTVEELVELLDVLDYDLVLTARPAEATEQEVSA